MRDGFCELILSRELRIENRAPGSKIAPGQGGKLELGDRVVALGRVPAISL